MKCWAIAGLAVGLVATPAEGPYQLDFLETVTTRQVGAHNWLAGYTAGPGDESAFGQRVAVGYAEATAIWQF